MPEEQDELSMMREREVPVRKKSYVLRFFVLLLCVAAIVGSVAYEYAQSPSEFTSGTVVHVTKNATLSTIAKELVDGHIIKSSVAFRLAIELTGRGAGVNAGDYLFTSPSTVWRVASRLIHNEQGFNPIKVTLPEGSTVHDMGDILKKSLSISSSSESVFSFNEKEFLSLASTSEGYLFPDTYLFIPNTTPAAVLAELTDTFNDKVSTLEPDVAALQTQSRLQAKTNHIYPRTIANIVTLASIVEREATSSIDRAMVAGILWKRLDSGVPLGVDPPFMYFLGKTSAEITLTDLATTSPYNTYVHKGLPSTPIGNPGLDALTATVHPTPSAFWFYFSDTKGNMHYATTYAEHLVNKAKYVK